MGSPQHQAGYFREANRDCISKFIMSQNQTKNYGYSLAALNPLIFSPLILQIAADDFPSRDEYAATHYIHQQTMISFFEQIAFILFN